MPWWTILNWVLRAVGVLGILLFAHVGVVGLYATHEVTSADGRILSVVVGCVFLAFAALLSWWLGLEWKGSR